VPYAWDITTGSSSIKIAVIDDGGEVHPDIPSTRIIQGYDFIHPDNNPLYNDPNDATIEQVIVSTD